MLLDAPTITMAAGVVTVASGLFLLTYWLQHRSEWPAMWWGATLCGMGVGIALLAVQAVLKLDAMGIVALVIFDVCTLMTWVAARIFNRGSVRPALVLCAALAWVAVSALVGWLGGQQVRASFGSAASGCMYVAAAVEFWLGRREPLRGRKPMMVVLCIFALGLFLNAVQFAVAPAHDIMPQIGWLGLIHFAGLIYAVGVAIFLVAMLRERSEARHKAAAQLDPLTGLANRRTFIRRAERLLERASRDGAPASLIAFDLDRFKAINDTYGHAAGDRVLCVFADALSRMLRPNDIAARMGGEEFAVLLSERSGPAAVAVAERIRAVFQGDGEFVDGQQIGATVSIGVATARGAALSGMLAVADRALYQAKRMGRNRVVVADEESGQDEAGNVVRIA
jgi:diguanylate cyclase (GGDEF)-like protein